MEFSGQELVSRQRNSNDSTQCQFKSKNCFMKLLRGVPVINDGGFPIYKTVSLGRSQLPNQWSSEDTNAPKKTHYVRITKSILDTNARNQAMAFNLSRESTLIEFQSSFLKLAESLGIKALFESVWINQKEWPLVTQPFYSEPTHIPMALFSNADRSHERNYANSWKNDHLRLEAAIVVLMKQMINKSAKPNMSIVEDVRDKDSNPFELYQSIKKALTSGEGSAESIRAKCNAMTGIDFSHGYDFLTIKRHFEDLFLKFKSQNGNIGFSDLEKVEFLTKLYERCNHSAVSSLNETLKNAISVGNIQTWDQATKLFEDQESKLKQRAADMIQAEQLLIQYKKQPSEQLKMYPATVNALTHETHQKTTQAKKSTVNLASSNTNDFERNIACYNCKQVGHKASACPRNHIQKSIEPFPDQGSWSYQDRQRGERERTRYDQSTFRYPDRSRSRDRDDRHRNDDDRRSRDRYSFRSVANSATQTNTTAGDSDWAQLQRDLQR